MALIKCPECGGQVSDTAPACIHCGYPLQEMNDAAKEDAKKGICCINGEEYDITWLQKECIALDNTKNCQSLASFCENKYQQFYNPHMSTVDNPTFFGLVCDTRLKYRLLENQISAKFIAECIKNNFEYFVFNSNDYKKPQNVATNSYSVPISTNVVRCPKCGSTSVTTIERGYDIMWGWIGAAQKKNLCQKCGYKWRPGR